MGDDPARGPDILVVDACREVRHFLSMSLGLRGHRVLEAGGASDATRLLRSHPTPVALLIAEVDPPRADGEALAALLGAMRPGLRLLCLSSHPREYLIENGFLQRTTPFLAKPFTLADLHARVAELTGQGGSGEQTAVG